MLEQLLKSNLQTGAYSGTLDLLNQDYPSKSIDQNQSRLVNMYLTPDPFKGEYAVVAYPLPGLEVFCDTGQNNVRALLEQNEITYTVAGNKFYSISSSGVKTERGTLNTSSGFCKMRAITGAADNNNQVVIIDGTNAYHYNIGTETATFPITDPDCLQTAIDIETQDDYFILLGSNSISFVISAVADGLSWSALDFASKTGQADKIAGIISNQRRLYLMGTRTIEPYFNSGDPDFPFERVQEIFLQRGLAAKNSLCDNEEYVIGLFKTKGGGYSVLKMEGYQFAEVSNESDDIEISRLTTKTDAIGYCYTKDSHNFYDLTFPTDNVTFTFDLTTGISSTRESSGGRFLGNCACFCYGKTLIGDYNSGKIYNQSTQVYTENGTAIERTFDSPPIYVGGRRITIRRLMVDVENNIGSNKTFTVSKSYDSGRTWTDIRTFTVGVDNNTRLYINSLGSARKWMFRISTTMNANFIILGFQVEAELGVH